LLIVDDILWIAGMEKLKGALYTVEEAIAICGNPRGNGLAAPVSDLPTGLF
jgi:hypothetical protein